MNQKKLTELKTRNTLSSTLSYFFFFLVENAVESVVDKKQAESKLGYPNLLSLNTTLSSV